MHEYTTKWSVELQQRYTEFINDSPHDIKLIL